MPKIDLQEGEEIEFKQQWTDKALEDLTAFANTRGGTLFVGIRKDGEVIGTTVNDAEIERLANIIVSRTGLTPSIKQRSIASRDVIEVGVAPARVVVSYGGRYFTRVGSTNRDLGHEELARLILDRSGRNWDGLPSPWGPGRVDRAALARFAELARGRLPEIDAADVGRTLQNLHLIREGQLTNAATLLFVDRPQELFPQARVRIGVFKGTQIMDTHEFEGTLWQQLDGSMERFRRLLQVRLDVGAAAPTLEGLQHKEVWEYPLEALREAVINALIHRDYAVPGDIQVRLHDDRLQVWNPGRLPEGIRPDQLLIPNHPSVPRNPLLARAFYFAGLIEQWGTGTTRMLEWCRNQDMPAPEFLEERSGFRVAFLKDPFTPERLRSMGLNDRQVDAVQYVRDHGSITNSEYRKLTGVKERTATAEMGVLVDKGVFERVGSTGRGTRYAARKAQKAR